MLYCSPKLLPNIDKHLSLLFFGFALSSSLIYALLNANVETFQFVRLFHTGIAQMGAVYAIALFV